MIFSTWSNSHLLFILTKPIIIGIGEYIISFKNKGKLLIIGCYHFNGLIIFKNNNL